MDQTRTTQSQGSDDVAAFLTDLWKDLLEQSDVHGGSNFFELGGDSLVALEVVVAVEERFDTEMAVTDLYEYPTVGELAEFVAAHS